MNKNFPQLKLKTDARSLMETPRHIDIVSYQNLDGQYWTYGVETALSNSRARFVVSSEIEARLKKFKKLYVVIERCKTLENIARGLKSVDVGTQTDGNDEQVNVFNFQFFHCSILMHVCFQNVSQTVSKTGGELDVIDSELESEANDEYVNVFRFHFFIVRF